MSSSDAYADALDRLEKVGSEAGFGIKPDLTRIEAIADLLDHPERTYPSIQVAGTNGKGSTARMIAHLLAAHGINTGLYTSPHLQSPRERFCLIGPGEPGLATELISQEEFGSTYGYLEPFIEMVEQQLRSRVTYFETLTSLAFEWMAQRTVGAAVFEAGMGGSWDATNIVGSSVAVLTPIDVDHVDRLGPRAVDAAVEKAGIIKRGAAVVSASQHLEVEAVIEKAAVASEADLLVEGRDFDVSQNVPALRGRSVALKTPRGSYGPIHLPLYGAHQGHNLASAIVAAESFLGASLDHDAIAMACAEMKHPGRMEIVSREPLIMLDGAHNPHAARALVAALSDSFPRRPCVVVASIMSDKDKEGILRELAGWSNRFILTASGGPRATDPQELARSLPLSDKDVTISEDMASAMDRAKADVPRDGIILVTGSLYAVGAARNLLVGPVP